MTPFDPNSFLESLVRLVAAAASLSIATPGREIWPTTADEASSAAIYTVARYYPGPRQDWEAVIARSIQWKTVGPTAQQGDVGLRAQKVYESLLNSEGRPLSMKTINGFKPDGSADGTWQIKKIVFLQTPGPIGLDAKNRPEWVFNTDISLCKLS